MIDPVFTLFPPSFKKIDFDKQERDFTFIVGNSEFKINKLIADLISPNVNRLHETDASASFYYINCNQNQQTINNSHFNSDVDIEINESDFKLIIDLSEGNGIQIDENNILSLDFFFKALGNNEINNFLSNEMDIDLNDLAFNESNQKYSLFDRTLNNLMMKDALHMPHDKEVNFISSHFYAYINNKKALNNNLMKLSTDTFYEILGQPNLCIDDEESLFNFILLLIEKNNDEFTCLFEFIEFENLSIESVKLFLNTISFESMNQKVWDSFLSFFNNKNNNENNHFTKRYRKQLIEISLDSNQLLDGVISYIQQSNGNVKVSSSSTLGQTHEPENAIFTSKSDYFATQNLPNQYFLIDLIDKQLIFRSYSLATCEWNQNNEHIKSWIVETSEDGENWIEVDRHENDSSLNKKNAVCNFDVQKVTKCSFIKIHQIGENWAGNNYLSFKSIEIFGGLIYDQ